MVNLTDRQRFALRESLCDQISDYSLAVSSNCWDEPAIYLCRSAFTTDGEPHKRWWLLKTLLELLGEWPVGFRGQGGWEKIEL